MDDLRRSALNAVVRMGSLIAICLLAKGAALHAQERVTFPTADSGVVSASVYGTGEHAVVLVHGGRFDAASWDAQALLLARSGFRVIAIDLRGRGESKGGRAGADSVHLDVLAAIVYARESGAARVSLVGASFGGGAVGDALTGGHAGLVDRVILLAHTAIDHPERLTGRKLFIVSRGDTNGRGESRLVPIRRQYELAPEPKRLLVLEGTAHAQFIFRTGQADRLLCKIIAFLSEP